MVRRDCSNKIINENSDMFGYMFILSAKKHLDSFDFIRKVMTCPECENLVLMDCRYEWCDEYYLFSTISRFIKTNKGEVLDDYSLWFMGYLYKYWVRTRNLLPKEVYKILPVEEFVKRLPFYYTQDWEYIICDALEKEEGNF